MLRAVYRCLWWLVAPGAVVRLLWRSRQEAGYRRHIGERFGFGGAVVGGAPSGGVSPGVRPLIWVHAVSVGETRGAQPLIDALLAAHPEAQLLITHMTPGGRAASLALFGDRVIRAYLPYDMRGPVRRFLRHYRPHVGVVMETEVWPTLIDECARAGVPLVLANARMSERSFRRAARFGAGARAVFGGLTAVLAQTEADRQRLAALGARRVDVLGNIKFDVRIDPALVARGQRWRAAIGARPVWVAASTREGEETLVLEAFARQLAVGPADALLILVPRHPQRFDEVSDLVSRAWRGIRRTAWAAAAPDAGLLALDIQVMVGDSMGELAAYYAAADLAFIGGSLVPTGSHNLIEAAAVGCPVLVGPHTFNFAQASLHAIESGAALRVDSPTALGESVAALLSDPARRRTMATAARAFAERDRGATARTVEALATYLAR
ncbi:lipid IV(A) 3-deoxy-D-manno-octulosonic acid transferase [Robbsia sp. Bb-Pol-6]|uniref:3-deoxy-D-manno-octulosonic acid transferase n=1 Tax=Robbsia betulipollinis TaxID=2981849 RepID=A0ABT3ZM19_9BURK|nr:lipid IV(A) 3-deoxy-D-manno-octulosonic acid transferase [Robbsia betulipollinis]MCY0387581.1 lipid IV(A) 3-deoxy-D-manno-octulosonic acid transferase [Robbsia betulipollinis]